MQNQYCRIPIFYRQLSFLNELDADQMENVIINHIGNATEEDKARIAFVLIYHSRLTSFTFQGLKSKHLILQA